MRTTSATDPQPETYRVIHDTIHIASGRRCGKTAAVNAAVAGAMHAIKGRYVVVETTADGWTFQSESFDVEAAGTPTTSWEIVEVSP